MRSSLNWVVSFKLFREENLWHFIDFYWNQKLLKNRKCPNHLMFLQGVNEIMHEMPTLFVTASYLWRFSGRVCPCLWELVICGGFQVSYGRVWCVHPSPARTSPSSSHSTPPSSDVPLKYINVPSKCIFSGGIRSLREGNVFSQVGLSVCLFTEMVSQVNNFEQAMWW